jgi:hypothetical protein
MDQRVQPNVPASSGALFVERKACPVCCSARLATLFSAPYTDRRVRGHVMSHYRNQGTVSYDMLEGVDFTVYKCFECDLVFQKMVPTGQMLDIVYNQFIDPEKLRISELARLTTDNFMEIARRLSDLSKTIEKEPKDIILLDYGFGYGRWARVAVGMGARVFATEITPEKMAFARSIGVEILTEDELPNFRFDVVHTEQVFEHLTYPAETFMLLSSCVAERGVFKIAVPQQGRIENLLKKQGFIDYSPYEFGFKRGQKDFTTIGPLEHINSFCRKPIEHMARRAGFVVRTGGFGSHHVDLDFSSFRSFVASCRAWNLRLAKDLYVRVGPGRRDNSCYLLYPSGQTHDQLS